jgi:hypothetical protein
MSTLDWHASDEMLNAYVRGETGVAVMASVEAHLLLCPLCRERIAAVSPQPALGAAWSRVVDRIQVPPAPLVVRMLRRLGLSNADGVLLSAARALDGAWALATLAVVVFAALAAIPAVAEGRALYLLVAPLIPVLGVVAAFAAADPLAGLTVATPYSKARLAFLRAMAVALAGVPLAFTVGVAVPGIAWLAFAWLIPALALTVVTLLAMTWWTPESSGIVTTLVWVAVIAIARAHHGAAQAVSADVQLVYALVAALAALALALRIRTAHTPGGYA